MNGNGHQEFPYGKILIGYPCREYGPCTAFNDSLAQLETVPGTLPPFQARNGVLPGARNRIVRKAQEVGADWIWWLDDDQLFAPNALKKLLSHKVDAVMGLSLRRCPPFAPLLYDRFHADGSAHQYYLKNHETGLMKMAGGGMGGLLIRRSILDRMEDPWFRFECSLFNNDDYAEDFPFYRRLSDMGVQLYADLSTPLTHVFQCGASPMRDQTGKWVTVLSTDRPFAGVPPAQDPSPIIVPTRVVPA